MKVVRSLTLGLVGVVMVVTIVVAVRTVTFKPQIVVDANAVKVAPSIPIDNALAARHLGEAIRIRTVSHQDASLNETAEWGRLHGWLQATYPAAHAAMRRTVVAERSLVYEWPGKDPSLAPIILMAHHDVVPVTEGTEKDWRHPPFAGEVADGAVWGRGAIDNKGSLVCLFEAIEALAARGFQPRRTVYVVSSQDEEVGGHGARAAMDWLQARGVMAQFTLDEGFAVLADYPATQKPVAIIGIAEKGYATLQVTAPSTGGHSSMPPPETGVITLARALVAIAAHPAPLRLDGPPAQMLDALAPSAPLKVRMAVANRWLFDPLLVRVMAATPAGAAMLHTTIAPTVLEGSPKENVLPQSARGLVNYRISPGDSSDAVMERARAAVGSLPVELAWHGEKREPSAVSSTTSDGWKVVAAAAAASSRAPVAPSLVIGGTDSRWLQPVSRDVYRFQPLVMSMRETSMVHGTNEHMTLANLALMTDFYARLIATAAG